MQMIEESGTDAGAALGPGARAGRAPQFARDASPLNPVGDGMRRIALEEMARGRRRLGELTPEQERALETLLMSVADNISELVTSVAARTPSRQQVRGLVRAGGY
jgi:hypothetical protein